MTQVEWDLLKNQLDRMETGISDTSNCLKETKEKVNNLEIKITKIESVQNSKLSIFEKMASLSKKQIATIAGGVGSAVTLFIVIMETVKSIIK